jgi:antitoxin (DNA-binding transcriptional repressor) of toxin-antitoxin stability system
MYHMKTATVRDLRYDFKRVERLLAEGEPIEITKRKRVIAKLMPAAAPPERPKMPDFLGRMRKTYGDKVLKTTGAEIVRGDRDA